MRLSPRKRSYYQARGRDGLATWQRSNVTNRKCEKFKNEWPGARHFRRDNKTILAMLITHSILCFSHPQSHLLSLVEGKDRAHQETVSFTHFFKLQSLLEWSSTLHHSITSPDRVASTPILFGKICWHPLCSPPAIEVFHNYFLPANINFHHAKKIRHWIGSTRL